MYLNMRPITCQVSYLFNVSINSFYIVGEIMVSSRRGDISVRESGITKLKGLVSFFSTQIPLFLK